MLNQIIHSLYIWSQFLIYLICSFALNFIDKFTNGGNHLDNQALRYRAEIVFGSLISMTGDTAENYMRPIFFRTSSNNPNYFFILKEMYLKYYCSRILLIFVYFGIHVNTGLVIIKIRLSELLLALTKMSQIAPTLYSLVPRKERK